MSMMTKIIFLRTEFINMQILSMLTRLSTFPADKPFCLTILYDFGYLAIIFPVPAHGVRCAIKDDLGMWIASRFRPTMKKRHRPF